MATFDLFSKRQKRGTDEAPDVYVYDSLPQTLRVQFIHIIDDGLGTDTDFSSSAEEAFASVRRILCREYGVFQLTERRPSTAREEVRSFILTEPSVDKVLDAVELCLFLITTYVKKNSEYRREAKPRLKAEDAVEELNARFQEHAVGYRFENEEMVRIDSELVHTEIVKPALALLRGPDFAGPNEEFRAAHKHLRHGNVKESLVEALKAFESTMKTICTRRGWAFDQSASAKNLIAICFDKGLLPPYLQSELASLRSLLESGVPTLRNKNGGHGQGSEPVAVPTFIAQYALNMTAATILFLVAAEGDASEALHSPP